MTRHHGVYRGPRQVPIAERFWQKVDKSAGDGACWPWTAGRDNYGYGRIGNGPGRSPAKAHRVAWELTNGPIPAGLGVLHECDNPPCVNPAHLFLGTQQDNSKDAARKGRIRMPGLRGEQHGNAKLTREQAREIFLRARAGEARRRIAADYGISRDNVGIIANRRGWTEATGDLL